MQKSSLNYIARVLCLVAFVAGSWAVLFKYYHLLFYDWDLAFFSQAAWNLCHGSQFTSLVGINYFGDHSYYITFLILPLFALFPSPVTLLLLKVAAFVLSAYLFYRIIREDHEGWVSLVLLVLYLVFPANIFSLLYEFNPESLAPVFLFLVYDFFRKEKYKAFLIVSLFLCLIKENMLLVIFMFGFYALLTKKSARFRWGWLTMLVSGGIFSALVFVVIPFFRQMHQHAFWVRYQHIWEHPLYFFSKVVTVNAGYVGDLFGALILPIVLAPQNLLFSAPIFAQHIFSNQFAEHSIYYHYGSALTPYMFLAASTGLSRASQLLSGKAYKTFVILLVLLSVGHAFYFLPAMKARFIVHKDNLDTVRWRMINQIPKDKGVIATFNFLAPLSMRKSLYSFHMTFDEAFQDSSYMKRSELTKDQPFQLPDDAAYALIDTEDLFFVRALKDQPELTAKRFDAFMKEWVIQERQGSILLLRRQTEPN